VRVLAIGNYIHYFPGTYLKYGITRRTNGVTKEEAIQSYANQKRSITQKVNQLMVLDNAEVADIEAKLNYFFSDNDISVEDQRIMEMVAEKIEEQFKIESKDIDVRTGKVITQPTDRTKQAYNKARKNLENNKNIQKHAVIREIEETNTYLRTIYGRLKILEAAIPLMLDSKEKNEARMKVRAAYHLLQDILGEKISTLKEMKDFNNHKIMLDRILNNTVSIEEDGKINEYNLISLINSLLKNSAILPFTNANKAQGQFFEDMIAVALNQGAIKFYSDLDKALEQVTSRKDGGNKGRMILEQKFLDGDVSWTNFSSQFQSGYEKGLNYIQTANISEGKVDVEIAYNNKTLPISAKSYSLAAGRNITLVDDTNLLYLLQDENSNYVNHYLNTIKSNSKNYSYYQELRKQGYLATAYTVIYKAFTGDTHSRSKKAEIFIVNDVTRAKGTNGVKVYSINQLIHKIFENAETIGQYSKIEISGAEGGTLENIGVEMPWVGDNPPKGNGMLDTREAVLNSNLAWDRIGLYLANVAKIKLHAALKPSIL
jgi:uncharacterized protein YdaU (DUF1376 family)